jgi:hypothetical protein
MKYFFQRFIFCKILFLGLFSYAQEIDLENIGKRTKETLKKNPFKISGGISANSIFYASDNNSSREPFTYFLNGNLNLGFYNWSLPISYTLTNQGNQLGYQVPFKFNRLSLTPKYKWVKAYIGDATLSFSPYTFNGLLFTGGGFELTPDIPFKIAMIAGQLNKAIEDDGNPATLPAYKRMGYGTHLKWEKDKYKLGLIGFYAKDEVHSLQVAPDTRNIFPQENLVLSLLGSFKLRENIEVFAEYANSALSTDIRSAGEKNKSGIASIFLKGNESTESFGAVNGGINLSIKKVKLGMRYERVDSDYRTLGAYFFNNDLENITANATFSLFKEKLSVTTNVGRQIDNLNKQKTNQTNQWIGAINLALKASEKLSFTGSYSNFTSFTNKQQNQFNNINNNPLQVQQPIDSIQFRQVSQNAGLGINFNLNNSKQNIQTLIAKYSFAEAVKKEDGIIRKGGISRFHNASVSYVFGLPEKKFSVNTALNYTNTYAASSTAEIFGPSVTLTKSYLKEDKLKTDVGISYNQSKNTQSKINTLNLRLGANYSPWKKHSFNLNMVHVYNSTQKSTENNKFNDLTATFGYNYSF